MVGSMGKDLMDWKNDVTLGTGVGSDLDSSSAKTVLQALVQPLSFEVLSQARSVTGNGIQDGR